MKIVYTGLIPPFYSMDDNLLLVIAFEKYLQKTNNKKFARQYYEQIKKAIDWYENKKSGELVTEYFLSNWMDTIFKSGKVLYTNVLYFKALEDLSAVASFLNKKEDKQFYFKKSERVKEEINLKFWNGKFYNSQKLRAENILIRRGIF